MEAVSKSAQEVRPTERLTSALSTLAALLDRTINEVRGLDSDVQHRMQQVMLETETTIRNQAAEQLRQVVAETEHKVRKETTESLKSQFEIDMRGALTAVRNEMEEEFKKTSAELSDQWEQQRRKLKFDLEHANKATSEAQAATQALIDKAKAVPPKVGLDVEAMMKEVERVETLISQISSLIDDPAVELSTIIRKNVERAELESYLRGIRFALGK